MRRLHVDYGECLIRLENSGKAVFGGNKTVMARRRFTESKSLPSFISFRPSRAASRPSRAASRPSRAASRPSRIAPRPSRIAPRPSRAASRRGERQFFKCFFHTGNDGRPSFSVRAGRTHDKGRGKAPNKRKGRSSPPPCMSGQDDTGLFCRRRLPFAGLIDFLLLRRVCLLCKRRIQHGTVCQPWRFGCAYH